MMCSNKFYINDEFYYTIKRIKNRIIHIPCDELKSKQRFFLNAIKWLYPYKADVLNSVKIHSGKKWILKMDIKFRYTCGNSDEWEKEDIKKTLVRMLETGRKLEQEAVF